MQTLCVLAKLFGAFMTDIALHLDFVQYFSCDLASMKAYKVNKNRCVPRKCMRYLCWYHSIVQACCCSIQHAYFSCAHTYGKCVYEPMPSLHKKNVVSTRLANFTFVLNSVLTVTCI
jgi:hypothetical protein